MKKSIFIILICFAIFLVLFCYYINKAPLTSETITCDPPPYLTVDGVPYQYTQLVKNFTPSQDCVSIGIIKNYISQAGMKQLLELGFNGDTEVYRISNRPGWLYACEGKTAGRFVAEELCHPLLCCNNKLYVHFSALSSYPQRPASFGDDYKEIGRLTLGELDSVPVGKYEVNDHLYQAARLYYSDTSPDTVYVIVKGGSVPVEFVEVSKTLLDYTFFLDVPKKWKDGEHNET